MNFDNRTSRETLTARRAQLDAKEQAITLIEKETGIEGWGLLPCDGHTRMDTAVFLNPFWLQLESRDSIYVSVDDRPPTGAAVYYRATLHLFDSFVSGKWREAPQQAIDELDRLPYVNLRTLRH